MAFWTEPETVPLQKHSFWADINLYKGKINTTTGIMGPPKRWNVPKHMIKTIDLPNIVSEIINESANHSSEAQFSAVNAATEFKVTFYLNPYMLVSLREAYLTYYTKAGSQVSLEYLSKASTVPAKELQANTEIVIYFVTTNSSGGQETRTLKYRNVLPISLDLGSLDYSSSDPVEATMGFIYTKIGNAQPAPLPDTDQPEPEPDRARESNTPDVNNTGG